MIRLKVVHNINIKREKEEESNFRSVAPVKIMTFWGEKR